MPCIEAKIGGSTDPSPILAVGFFMSEASGVMQVIQRNYCSILTP